MYYLFKPQSWESYPARIIQKAYRQKLWWDNGESFDRPPTDPVQATLKPFDSRHPSMSETLAPYYYDASIPLFRDDLLEVFEKAGVDNLDVYPAEILDPDTGNVHTNYKAVNILGLVAAADMEKSGAIVHDGIPLVDVSFDEMVLDPSKTHGFLMFRSAENNSAILVHQHVRDAVLRAGFKELNFYQLDEVAI